MCIKDSIHSTTLASTDCWHPTTYRTGYADYVMHRISPLLLAAAAVVCFLATCPVCHGWNNSPTRRIQTTNHVWHHRVTNEMVVALTIGCVAVFAPAPLVPCAFADMSLSSLNEERIRQSLKPPTASKPQIVLPQTTARTSSSSSSNNNKDVPIIEGKFRA